MVTELEKHIKTIHGQLGFSKGELVALCYRLVTRTSEPPEECYDIIMNINKGDEDG